MATSVYTSAPLAGPLTLSHQTCERCLTWPPVFHASTAILSSASRCLNKLSPSTAKECTSGGEPTCICVGRRLVFILQRMTYQRLYLNIQGLLKHLSPHLLIVDIKVQSVFQLNHETKVLQKFSPQCVQNLEQIISLVEGCTGLGGWCWCWLQSGLELETKIAEDYAFKTLE